MSGERPPGADRVLGIKLRRGVQSGRVQLVAMCRKLALEEGTTLEAMLWEVIKGMTYWAARGDAACAKLVLGMLARDEPDEAPDITAGAADAELGNGQFQVSDEFAAELKRVRDELGDDDDEGEPDEAAKLLR